MIYLTSDNESDSIDQLGLHDNLVAEPGEDVEDSSASCPQPPVTPITVHPPELEVPITVYPPVRRIDITKLPHGDPPGSPKGAYRDILSDWCTKNPPIDASEEDKEENKEENMPVLDPPEGLMQVQLYPHQRRGLAWLVKRENNEPIGGILADNQVRIDTLHHYIAKFPSQIN